MRRWIGILLRAQWFYLLLVILILSTVTTAVNPLFLTLSNIVSILKQISVLGMVAAGATILIISGNFDISVGATIGLAMCVMAMLIRADVHVAWAVLAGLYVAMACCLFVGEVSILLRAPSFIVSLACIGVFQGIALALTNGNIQTVQEKIGMPGDTTLLGLFPTLFRFLAVIVAFFAPILGFFSATIGALPVLFLICLAGLTVMHFLLTYTRLGRRVYSIGSNPRAAYLSGIDVHRNKLTFFGLNGLYVGIAAVLLLLRVGSALPSTGTGTELKAIGAVIVGGAPMSGGKGKIIGTFLGVLLMGMIPNVTIMLDVSAYYESIAFGLLIIAALAVTALSQRTRRLG